MVSTSSSLLRAFSLSLPSKLLAKGGPTKTPKQAVVKTIGFSPQTDKKALLLNFNIYMTH